MFSVSLVVDDVCPKDWYRVTENYKIYHQGVIQRAEELGFSVETFFLKAPSMGSRRINDILQARGIQGVILAMPYKGNRALKFQWDCYAIVASGKGSEGQDCDRVCSDHVQNVVCAFEELKSRGYRRIGMTLPKYFCSNSGSGSQWYLAYNGYQENLPKGQRIPILEGGVWSSPLKRFRDWYLKWNPEVLLTLVGHEKQWTDKLGIRVPEELGIVCLSREASTPFAGIDARVAVEGILAVDRLVEKMGRNEYGLPKIPVQTLVEGVWVDGITVASRDQPAH